MTNELTFIADSLFDKVIFDKDGENWIFILAKEFMQTLQDIGGY
jgi:hypothetical protein